MGVDTEGGGPGMGMNAEGGGLGTGWDAEGEEIGTGDGAGGRAGAGAARFWQPPARLGKQLMHTRPCFTQTQFLHFP